jgi:D-arabinose 1-dehydrogenase-like Zn-dependent alcohol dehydrogenase
LAEALAFAAQKKVAAHIRRMTLQDVNQAFADLRSGNVAGRIVIDLQH